MLFWLYIPLVAGSLLASLSLYFKWWHKLSVPAQITRLIFHAFRLKAKYWTGMDTLRSSSDSREDNSLQNLSEQELALIYMMDTLIGKFDGAENQVPVDNDFMDKDKPREEIIAEIAKFRETLPAGIHQSKAGPFFYPEEKVYLRTNFENIHNKNPSIYFNFHDMKLRQATTTATKNDQRIALIHFHGGGYIMGEPSTCYTMEKLCSENGFDLFGVDYSLYPENNIEDAIEDAFKAFKWLVDEKQPSDVIIFGESAGGHLGLMLCDRVAQEREKNSAFAQQNQYNCIRGYFGFSPWCDVSMSSKGMNDPNHCDRALPNKALNQFKKWGIPLGFHQEERAKKLSPIHFDSSRLDRLKQVNSRYLFSYSTNERLCSEIETFMDMLENGGCYVEKHTVTIPFHCFHVFCDFIPEQFSKLEKQLETFILNSTTTASI
ncbi:hypothetical protein C9374_007856 [Naegleria lovaniensis]|uniref:Alpha/beta hydrolase fold-3 domain-containing protein n=1 Tax=Naegleria lovaniensis TaxID=51637 RepID=A0AA88GHL0_NAELO|nr:uncharacterized protein C9374_007856 [Naegleria lovaniensis]KAG2378708.1 hypothetical protein C9374_007856 [Naegleria lovaniensis]